MYIKASSVQHRKDHNIILESELEDCTGGNSLSLGQIGASFRKIEDPDFLSIHDDALTKNIIFAIDLTSSKPFKCYILTNEEKMKEYQNNPHYKDVRAVIVKGGDEAIKIIDDFFNAFVLARERSRI
jgi:hypothetical protein